MATRQITGALPCLGLEETFSRKWPCSRDKKEELRDLSGEGPEARSVEELRVTCGESEGVEMREASKHPCWLWARAALTHLPGPSRTV